MIQRVKIQKIEKLKGKTKKILFSHFSLNNFVEKQKLNKHERLQWNTLGCNLAHHKAQYGPMWRHHKIPKKIKKSIFGL